MWTKIGPRHRNRVTEQRHRGRKTTSRGIDRTCKCTCRRSIEDRGSSSRDAKENRSGQRVVRGKNTTINATASQSDRTCGGTCTSTDRACAHVNRDRLSLMNTNHLGGAEITLDRQVGIPINCVDRDILEDLEFSRRVEFDIGFIRRIDRQRLERGAADAALKANIGVAGAGAFNREVDNAIHGQPATCARLELVGSRQQQIGTGIGDGEVVAVAVELHELNRSRGHVKAIEVERAASGAEAAAVAYAIAHSPLVKTAFFASDPNLGRILAAVGYAGIADLDVDRVDLYLDDVHVATRGGRHPAYREEDGQRVMKQAEIRIRVVLGRGDASTTVWTCDLSHDYVSINADYRS